MIGNLIKVLLVVCQAVAAQLSYGATVRAPQETYCNAGIVIKAQLLKIGYIRENPDELRRDLSVGTEPPKLLPHYVRLEIKVLHVYKTNGYQMMKHMMKDTLHYVTTKDTSWNQDADGWDFGGNYNSIVGEEALLFFQDWNNIVLEPSCILWRYVKSFQRNILKKGGYDCSCSDVSQCHDRLHKTIGLPTCGENRELHSLVQLISCSVDKRSSDCTWKGAKGTCINPNTRKLRRHRL